MDFFYNKILSKIIWNVENNKDNSSPKQKPIINYSIQGLSETSCEYSAYDSDSNYEELGSSISSINSTESDDDLNEDKITIEKINDEIKISEITKNSSDLNDNGEVNKISDTKEIIAEDTYLKITDDEYESSEDEINNKLTIESVIEKKYLNSLSLNKKKYYEEIKELNLSNFRILEINVIKNIHLNVSNALSNGEVLYKKDENYNITKLCSNKNCNNKCDNKLCSKSALYYSLWNNIRGIKTIYNLLLKLIIGFPKFRNKCKCCEEEIIRKYLEQLENNFTNNIFNYQETDSLKLELKINYLINKFMSVIGIMACQCKFINKYYEFYQDNYLNFRKSIQIYKRTIMHLIPLLKTYFKIKENYEELYLVKGDRCMHEDIRYNNFSYCLKKEYNTLNEKKIIEIINNLDIVNNWLLESFEISTLLFNQQSLETFRHILYKYKKEINIVELFKKIYDKKNNMLNINYNVNKTNLINSILYTQKNNKKFEYDTAKKLFNLIIHQLHKKISIKNKDHLTKFNEIMILYVLESYNYNNLKLGFEFFKNIKDLDSNFLNINRIGDTKYLIINKFPNSINKNSTYAELLKYIFDGFLNSAINYQIKNSYLKVINKNKTNIINYDFINKLIDIEDGEKVILDMYQINRNDINNYFLNLPDYDNINYINSTIKKCILKKRVNILNYFLNEIKCKIKEDKINPYIIYFANIEDYKKEYEYIDILNVISKYNYDINSEILLENKNKNNFNFLHFCIQKKLNKSGKILLKKNINTKVLYENRNFLYYCVDNKNQILFNEIINCDGELINQTFNNLKIHTYLFSNKELDENILMRFMIKLLENDRFEVNYSDKYNIHIGFQILEAKISKRNKVLLFKIISERIQPLFLNNNIPLILYTTIINEYEITYMLLNKLFADKIIKKIPIQKKYLEYEYTSDKISINFIPIVLKYIAEHSNENDIIINEIYLEVDLYAENILIIIIEMTIFILRHSLVKNQSIKFNKYDDKKIILEKQNYRDIGNNNYNAENGFIELSLDTDDNLSLENVNKNIWKNPNVKINKKDNCEIKFNFKSETIEENNSSEIEESNVCFESLK